VFGGTNVGAGGSIDPSTLDGTNGFVINGINQNEGLGSSVKIDSDLNGDGIADLIMLLVMLALTAFVLLALPMSCLAAQISGREAALTHLP
jgi:hypothetical protein